MKWINEVLREDGFKKTVAFLVLVTVLFLIKDMFNIVLLTFIIGFILSNVQNLLQRATKKWFVLPEKLGLIIVYVLALSGLGYLLFTYIPVIVTQLTDIFNLIARFSFNDLLNGANPVVNDLVSKIEIGKYISEFSNLVLENLQLIWNVAFEVIMAFLLSFLFLWEKKQITHFMVRFENSRVSFAYNYYKQLAAKFLNSFGKMIQLQIIISTVNTFLSAIMLIILGFEQIIGLSFMIFVLGLIPVAGVIISLVPLSLIAFQIGGVGKVIAVLIMIAIIHAIESYVLNPKITSKKMHLPVFFTFFILLFGEHYLGIWGLLLGLPLVVFFLDLVEAKPREEKDTEANITV